MLIPINPSNPSKPSKTNSSNLLTKKINNYKVLINMRRRNLKRVII